MAQLGSKGRPYDYEDYYRMVNGSGSCSWTGGWVIWQDSLELVYITSQQVIEKDNDNGVLGSEDNPFSSVAYNEMHSIRTWPGGYVKDDAGVVSYVMKSVIVYGYSGSGSGSDWHGSDFEFCTGSYEWHEPDIDNRGSDEDGKGNLSDSGKNGTGIGGNTGGGGGGGGGGGYRPAAPNINDGKNGAFLYNAAYYTEGEYIRMCENGTWTGGNVYTLGYVGKDCVINPCLTSIDSNDHWLVMFKDKASAILDGIKRLV